MFLELISSYIMNIYDLNNMSIVLITSESLIFLINFITYYNISYGTSILYIGLIISNGIILTCSYSLSLTNSIILSNGGLLLCIITIVISNNIKCLCRYICLYLIYEFLIIQVIEFNIISLYSNECILCIEIYILIGLHLFHVIIGINLLYNVLMFLYYNKYCYNLIIYQL
jgi:heme/copper-type cytochrome/quinol oxidase subunit 3